MMKRTVALALLLGCVSGYAVAQDVTIVRPGAQKSRIDLSGLKPTGKSAAVFYRTLEEDLKRSGWFVLQPRRAAAIRVEGTCTELEGEIQARCDVKNVSTGKRYFKRKYEAKTTDAHKLAHRVADDIVTSVRKVPGIASTRIVVIGSRSGRKNLYLCDADGRNLVQLTRDNAVCLSPSWTPDARRLVYTSFHKGFPDVYEIDLAKNLRTRIAAFPGLNAGADVSPDGREMVLTLSKDGNPDLYVVNRKSGRLKRITRTPQAAEASPSWSPEGDKIVFVSNRAGTPQLYVTDRAGKKTRRLTFRGSENVAPDWGPGGAIAYCSRRDRRYHICVINPETGKSRQLTEKAVDHEDPSWAPDGRHIAYCRTAGYRSEIYVLDTEGDPPVRLIALDGDWYCPVWSPNTRGR